MEDAFKIAANVGYCFTMVSKLVEQRDGIGWLSRCQNIIFD